MKTFIEIFGWYGAGAILLGYTLVSFDIVSSASLWYHLLNFTGALGIVVVSIYKRAYQPGALNIIWALIAIIAIVRVIV